MKDHETILSEVKRRAAFKKKISERRRGIVVTCVSTVLCVSLMLAALLPASMLANRYFPTIPGTTTPGGTVISPPSGYGKFQLSSVTLPTRVKFPNLSDYGADEIGKYNADYKLWAAEKYALEAEYLKNEPDVADFLTRTSREFLMNAGTENVVYSPISAYISLAMLAEVSGGNSRAQILRLLGAESIDELRKTVPPIWNSHYSDDGMVTNLLANSIWIDEKLTVNDDVIDRLAEIYYTEAMTGEMGSDEFNEALRDWMKSKTEGLLDDEIDNIKLLPNYVFALASTVYFNDGWETRFSEALTKQGVFHGAENDDIADFMNSVTQNNYYRGDGYAAVCLALNGDYKMWVILPDEESSVDAVLAGDALEKLFAGKDPGTKTNAKVNLSIPKFDVCSDIDMTEHLKALGVTDMFLPGKLDLTITNQKIDSLRIMAAQQTVRVKIDEDGVTAAGYSLIAPGADEEPPKDEIDFVADRPFIFVLTDNTDFASFTGVVNKIS